VDEEAFAPLEACPRCGEDVDGVEDVEQFVVDLPEVKPHVRRIVTQRGWCLCCRRNVRSTHPWQTSTAGGAAQTSLGPRAMGLAAELKHRKGMPYRDIAELFQRFFGLRVTHGALVQGCLRVSRRGETTYQALVRIVQRSAVVHTDDTGWRIDSASAWLWVFATTQVTVYVVARSRGSDVVLGVLGENWGGVLVSDGLPALDTLDKSHGYERAQCLGHLLRRAREMAAEQIRGAVRFPRAVKELLQAAIALSHRHGELAPSTMRQYGRAIERRADRLLAANVTHVENRKLRDHLVAHRGQLFRCLYDPRVPPTNNLAEQQLRGAVITRKIGGCNRTDEHAHSHAVLASVAQTAYRNGATLTDFVRKWLSVHPPGHPWLHLRKPLSPAQPSLMH
jgi:transposase